MRRPERDQLNISSLMSEFDELKGDYSRATKKWYALNFGKFKEYKVKVSLLKWQNCEKKDNL